MALTVPLHLVHPSLVGTKVFRCKKTCYSGRLLANMFRVDFCSNFQPEAVVLKAFLECQASLNPYSFSRPGREGL